MERLCAGLRSEADEVMKRSHRDKTERRVGVMTILRRGQSSRGQQINADLKTPRPR
jgi:hypothetical protein